MELTGNLGLLIVLAVATLLLPLCDLKPNRGEPFITDADDGDESALV